MKNNDYPILYILMRSDMDSLNPGKGMAQAAHAANMFGQIKNGPFKTGKHPSKDIEEWFGNRGFGTTIVLDCGDELALKNIINCASISYKAGIVMDETYPIRDGKVTHLLPVNTCGYVFCPTGERENMDYIYMLPLYK